jgi:hypothetical protein
MNFRKLAAGTLAFLATLGAAAIVQAADVRQSVHGRVRVEGSRTRLDYRIDSHRDTDKGRAREDVHVHAKKLDTTKDADGNPPDYHLWLVTKDGAEADFGFIYLNRGGAGHLHFRSSRDAYPTDVTTVTSFGEGKIQVRTGATVVIEGTLPKFLVVGDTPVEDSKARVDARARLTAAETDSRAKGAIEARYQADAKRSGEKVSIRCDGLAGDRSPYSVVAIAADMTATDLFTGLLTGGRHGGFHATLDTRQGHTIPGGGLLGLSEQSIEVRDKDGVVVLTGTFPDMTIE